MADFEGILEIFPTIVGFFALVYFVVGVGVIARRRWARRTRDRLRTLYQQMDVTDPRYNAVRALYLSAAIDHDRHAAAIPPAQSAEAEGGDSGGAD